MTSPRRAVTMQNHESPEHATEVVEEAVAPSDSDDATLPSAGPDVTPSAGPELAQAASPSFVYALGEIDFRFPSLGLEKEVAQVIGSTGIRNVIDRHAVQAAIAEDQNRYLARGLCWILTVGGLEAYILVPRDPADYRLLIEAVREYPNGEEDQQSGATEPGRRPSHVDVVIGMLGPIAPPEICNGLSIRMVFFDQIYSFDRASLIRAIPTPQSVKRADESKFRETAGSFFDHIMQMADNAGATDEHRALNYLAVRYPRIYATVTEEQGRNASLAGISARHSPLSEVRRVVDVIFSFRNWQTDVITKYLTRVDVDDMHPFLMTPISPYYDVS
jgi:hypothetical protein